MTKTVKKPTKPSRRNTPTPSKRAYSDEDIGDVIRLMGSEGISLKAAALKSGISYSCVQHRITISTETQSLYARETEEYARTKVSRLNEIAETVEDVNRARLMCDNIKWEAQRVCRKLYGDKQDVSLVVKHEDALDSLE